MARCIGKVATSPVSSTTRYYDPAMKLAPHDVKAAVALLDEAGLKPGPDGVRFKIRHLTLPYGEVWTRLAEYIRASLKQVGIEVTPATLAVGDVVPHHPRQEGARSAALRHRCARAVRRLHKLSG